jgi:DNA-binding NarL/FixJ family response regulator
MRTLKVLVADDHRLMLEALRVALSGLDDMELVGEASSGPEVLPMVSRTNPDLVVLDFRMPGIDGLTCLDRIRSRHPNVKVAMLSADDDPAVIDAALTRGANAYIVKSIDPRDLPSALRQAVRQSVFQAPARSESTAGRADDGTGLSPSELKVLKAMALGRSNKEIAQELWLSDQTVKFHLRNIYRKLEIASRTEAIGWAYAQGIASPLVDAAAAHP